MKEFSHPKSDNKVATNINNCIESTITISKHTWKYHAEMEVDLDPSIKDIMCYPDPFNEVILNIIVNAQMPSKKKSKTMIHNSELSSHEKLVLQDIPLISNKMINHIPRLENIAEMVRLSNEVNHLIHKDLGAVRGRVLRGADILKIALKFDKILESGHNLTSAINLLQQGDELNPEIIEKLSNIKIGHEEDALTVNVNNLLPGMVLLEDMITDNQSTLLAKGTELTEALLLRIRLYTQNQKMSRPIKIVTLN
jgi:hypothetical protein